MNDDERREWQPLEETIPAELLRAEVRAWAKRIGVEPREIRIRRMVRKWASCSTRGNVTLNVELLSQPAAFRAEAIVHELLHFRVPNHGPLFRALLKGYLGEREGEHGR